MHTHNRSAFESFRAWLNESKQAEFDDSDYTRVGLHEVPVSDVRWLAEMLNESNLYFVSDAGVREFSVEFEEGSANWVATLEVRGEEGREFDGEHVYHYGLESPSSDWVGYYHKEQYDPNWGNARTQEGSGKMAPSEFIDALSGDGVLEPGRAAEINSALFVKQLRRAGWSEEDIQTARLLGL